MEIKSYNIQDWDVDYLVSYLTFMKQNKTKQYIQLCTTLVAERTQSTALLHHFTLILKCIGVFVSGSWSSGLFESLKKDCRNFTTAYLFNQLHLLLRPGNNDCTFVRHVQTHNRFWHIAFCSRVLNKTVGAAFEIVVLQVKLEPLELGTSADLLVGQRVFAVGNPFGLDHSLTTGAHLV